MIALILARLGISRGLFLTGACLALIALAATGYWRGMAAIDRMVAEARDAAAAERDMHWQTEIAKSNASVERERAEQRVAAATAEANASATLAALTEKLNDLEARNAALPNSDRCGIDRDRIRLLNR